MCKRARQRVFVREANNVTPFIRVGNLYFFPKPSGDSADRQCFLEEDSRSNELPDDDNYLLNSESLRSSDQLSHTASSFGGLCRNEEVPGKKFGRYALLRRGRSAVQQNPGWLHFFLSLRMTAI